MSFVVSDGDAVPCVSDTVLQSHDVTSGCPGDEVNLNDLRGALGML